MQAHYPLIADHPDFDRPPIFSARDNKDHGIIGEIDLVDRFMGLVEDLLCI